MATRFTVVVLLSTFSLAAFAADPPAQKEPAAAASPAASTGGPKAQEFARISKEFNELIANLSALRSEYETADSKDKQAAIAAKFNPQRKKAEAMANQVVEAAEQAYLEAPNADAEVIKVLIGTLVDQIEHDDYEPAFARAKMLMEHKCPSDTLPALAGIAAYCVNEYDLAEPWLKAASASGALNQLCEGLKQRDHAKGPRYYVNFPQTIEETKTAWAKEKKIRDAEAKADDLPRVLLKTSKGDIVIELLENEAPNTVLNFITLVESKFYDGVVFHRVLPGFMAQGGDPKGTGSGGPGYTIPCECYRPDHRLHYRGTLSMAHAGRDTGGSQFFLTFLPTSHLDGKHTVFGRVIGGFDVLAKLKRIDPEEASSATADKIIEAKVLRKRKHPYEAKDVKKSGTRD